MAPRPTTLLSLLLLSSASALRPAVSLRRRDAVRALLAVPLAAPLAASAGLVGVQYQYPTKGEPSSAPKPFVATGNSADDKFAEIVAADLIAKEKMFGEPLDDESKATFEMMLRNKYCGPQGLSSGWGLPGGSCRESDGCDQAVMGSAAGCNTNNKGFFKKKRS